MLEHLPPVTPPPPQWSQPSAVPPAEDRSSTRRRVPLLILGRALGITAAGTALPGLGHLLLGRRRVGGCILGIFLLTLGGLTIAAVRLGPTGLLQGAVSTPVLARVTAACVLTAVGWTVVVVWTYLLARPRAVAIGYQVLGAVVAAALCAAVARSARHGRASGPRPADPARPGVLGQLDRHRRFHRVASPGVWHPDPAASAERAAAGQRRRARPGRCPHRHHHGRQHRHPDRCHHPDRPATQHRARAVPARHAYGGPLPRRLPQPPQPHLRRLPDQQHHRVRRRASRSGTRRAHRAPWC